MRETIYKNEIYAFKAKTDSPLILDCGANVGLSIRYFKKLYPQARIIAFEPDPQIFQVLQKNCEGLTHVELHERAVWTENGFLEFTSDGSDAGRLTSLSGDRSTTKVKTVCLRDYLSKPVDFLKVDIEGAEVEVLKNCSDLLIHVEHLFVEYHGFVDRSPHLSVLLEVLEKAGFRYHIESDLISPKPFLARHVRAGMDSTLNISAYRPQV
jgi:FkbM family methyltransferase